MSTRDYLYVTDEAKELMNSYLDLASEIKKFQKKVMIKNTVLVAITSAINLYCQIRMRADHPFITQALLITSIIVVLLSLVRAFRNWVSVRNTKNMLRSYLHEREEFGNNTKQKMVIAA